MPTSVPYSCMRYQIYSIVGETDDALSELSSLRVFQIDKRTPALDLVDVFDLSGQPRKSGEFPFHDADDLDKYLVTNQMIGGIRFISLFQKDSWASLEVCGSMLRHIMIRHHVMPEFLSVVRCFRDKTSNVEQAFGGTSWMTCGHGLKG